MTANQVNWQIRLIRFTLFLTSPLDIKSFDFDSAWNAVTDIEPEVRRIPNESKVVYLGTVNPETGEQIVNENTAQRVDWYIKPVQDLNVDSMTLSSIGDWEEMSDKILSYSKKIIETINYDVKRVAFGSMLHTSVDTIEESQRQLFNLLPVNINSDQGEDFLFQLNIPTVFPSSDLKVNRLSKWGAINVDIQQVSPEGITTASESLYNQVEIDINTDKRNEEILNKSLADLFAFLIEQGSQLLHDGISLDK